MTQPVIINGNADKLGPLDEGLDQWCNAYRRLLQDAASIAKGQQPARDVIDSSAVAVASRSIGKASHYQAVDAELKLCHGRRLLSIACATGEVATRFVKRHPENTAIGIDRSPQACQLALKAAQKAGVGDRLRVLVADLSEIERHASTIFAGVDVVEASFVFHDYRAEHGEEGTLAVLKTIANSVPSDAVVLIAEVVHAGEGADWFHRVFSVVHQIQGIYLPTDNMWRSLFERAGFAVVKAVPALMPGSILYRLEKGPRVESFSGPISIEVPGHHLPVSFYLHPNFTGGDIAIAAVDLGNFLGAGPASPHRHHTVEYYVLPAYSDSVSISVKVDEHDPLIFSSPAIIRIPAGSLHHFEVIKAQPGQLIFGVFQEVK